MMPRSRYHPGAAFLAIVTGLGVLLGLLASPRAATPGPDAKPLKEPKRVGMMSCAARGCHGGVGPVDPTHGDVYIKGGESTTWLQFDPHARAYDALLERRSIDIAAKLKGPLQDKPAHEAAMCLVCHATAGPPEPIAPGVASVKDGITCESCHGPAEVWQDAHLAADWRATPKPRDGMTDLSTPRTRAQSCLGCHVGNRAMGQDVNHDLIAAGHPRLNFEFSTYQANYPKHWKERHEKDPKVSRGEFEAKSWAIGQAVTAEASLHLLIGRIVESSGMSPKSPTAAEAVWPEFAESECFACHHDLAKPSHRQLDGQFLGKPGVLPWSTWATALIPRLSQKHPVPDFDAIQAEMGRPDPDARKVYELAQLGWRHLSALENTLESETFDQARVESLLKELSTIEGMGRQSWDRSTQAYLGLSALVRAAKGLGVEPPPEVVELLRTDPSRLGFPSGFDSPRGDRYFLVPKP